MIIAREVSGYRFHGVVVVVDRSYHSVFQVALGEIGEIQKLRVHREETPSWKAWHLEEVLQLLSLFSASKHVIFAFCQQTDYLCSLPVN